MAPIERSKNLRLLVSEEELAMAHALAEADGLSVSDVVRSMLRRVYAERFGDKKPKIKK
jgi:antitoxin component of RelBE/YafQ-DinJ toxin-antitoxin module